jgi:hypothetical protein
MIYNNANKVSPGIDIKTPVLFQTAFGEILSNSAII